MTQEIVKKQLRSLKNAENFLNVRRKESSIWRINKDFYLKNRKSVRKVSKTRSGNEF